MLIVYHDARCVRRSQSLDTDDRYASSQGFSLCRTLADIAQERLRAVDIGYISIPPPSHFQFQSLKAKLIDFGYEVVKFEFTRFAFRNCPRIITDHGVGIVFPGTCNGICCNQEFDGHLSYRRDY